MKGLTPVQIVTEWLDDDEDLRIPDTEWGRRLHDALRTILATVAPNPADMRQVEAVARTICIDDGQNPDEVVATQPSTGWVLLRWKEYSDPARAALTALAAEVGRG